MPLFLRVVVMPAFRRLLLPAPALLLPVLLAAPGRAAAEAPLFIVVQISDSQPQTTGECDRFEDVLRTIAMAGQPGALLPRPVDLVLFAGDITWGNTSDEWVQARQKLDTWLTANDIPYLAVPGNHDVNNGDTALYQQYIASSAVWDAGSAAFTGHNGKTRTTSWAGLRFIGFNNSNPGWNTVSPTDVAIIQSKVSTAAAAAENTFLLCHHPHDEKDRIPLRDILPEPSIVGYLRGHIGTPHIRQGLAGIANPNIWDMDTNAIVYDRDLFYYEVFETELRAHIVILDNNPTGLPPPLTIPLVHPLRLLSEPDRGSAGPSHASARPSPSGKAPEKKLWHHDGSWWGVLWSEEALSYRIFRLDPSSGSWTDTGTAVSSDSTESFDVLVDGSRVYLAFHVPAVPSQPGQGSPGRITRLSHVSGSGSYSAAADFPVALNDARSETLVLAKDSSGVLWASWTENGSVFVNHSLESDLLWDAPLALPFTSAAGLDPEDTSALVSLGGNLGVMWTDRGAGTIELAIHADGDPAGAWLLETALSEPGAVGEGLDLAAHGGRLFAATRAPGGEIRLLERDGAPAGQGSWSLHPVVEAAAGLADPILLVDEDHALLRLFAAGPTLAGASALGGGAIYEKESPLASIGFLPGRGSPIIQDGVNPAMAQATSTRQAISAASGLAVLATNELTRRYWYAFDPLAAPIPPPSADFTASPRFGEGPLSVQFTDLSGGDPTGWQWSFGDGATSDERRPLHVYTQTGHFSVTLAASNGGGSSTLTRSSYVEVVTPPLNVTFTPVADAFVYEGNQSKNYRADPTLRVKQNAGTSYQSFLKFDFSSLAGLVASARLRLFCTDPSSKGGAFYLVENTWTETGVTWSNKPALPAAELGRLGGVTSGFWYEIDVSSAVTGAGVVSFAIATNGSTNSAFYSSREGAHPPELVVTRAESTVPPAVDFSASPLSGVAPLSVAFTDLSTGGPTSFLWAFGNGDISSEKNPVHVYTEAGTYSVRLQASNSVGSDSLEQDGLITVSAPPPTATFAPIADARVYEGSAGSNYGLDAALRVKAAAGTAYRSYLKFDLSSLPGSVRSARLRFLVTDSSNSGGTLYQVSSGWTETGINWNNKPALPATPIAALGAVAAGNWVEIDVSSAVTASPVVSFALAGGSTDSVYYSSREGTGPPQLVVEIGPLLPPVADFFASPPSGVAALPVTFTDLSSGPPTTWLWTFGDGGTSTERNPVHLYTEPGTYSVTLDVSNDTGNDSRTWSDLISVTPAPLIATFLPVMDARVNEASPSSNYGRDAALRLRFASGGSHQSYLRFDLSTLAGSPTSARLRLFVTDGSDVGGIVYRTSGGWTETGLTWTNRPAAIGSPIASAGTVVAGSWVELDVTSAVTGPGEVNFAVTSTSSNSTYFSSREGANPPELVVGTVSGP